MWDHEERVLAEHDLSHGDRAILIAAYYCIPLPRDEFIPYAAADSHGFASKSQTQVGFDRCFARGLITLTTAGHLEKDLDVFGKNTGESTEYPAHGVVLTEAGRALHAKVSLAIFGSQYFENEFVAG